MPLSMFSIVGLIGMAGIIINDSIVLVSTIDQYSERRGLRPAIIDGVADRFRPVLLTTLTTVLGLAPLLYEQSSQAEFLKPTVITLVFGLGFGMVLVLVVVPALLAAQTDVARAFRALQRVLRRGPRGARLAVASGAAGMLVLAVALPLWTALTGALPGWLVALWPGLASAPVGAVAAGMFLIGALALWVVSALAALVSLRQNRSQG
jgi:predicted RND superfamily exporter protein